MKTKRHNGVQTPSKYMSLERLERIKADNYVGANGIDYAKTEVDQLITVKRAKKGKQATQSMESQYDQLEAERIRLLGMVSVMREQLKRTKDKKGMHDIILKFGAEKVIPVARALGTLPANYTLTVNAPEGPKTPGAPMTPKRKPTNCVEINQRCDGCGMINPGTRSPQLKNRAIKQVCDYCGENHFQRPVKL